MKPKFVIYISGLFSSKAEPYSFWEQECNVRVAEVEALAVWRAGHVALCPHTLTRNYAGTLPYETWLTGELELLSRCDGMLLLRGWQDSPGARREKAHAESLGIPVSEDLQGLLERLEQAYYGDELSGYARD